MNVDDLMSKEYLIKKSKQWLDSKSILHTFLYRFPNGLEITKEILEDVTVTEGPEFDYSDIKADPARFKPKFPARIRNEIRADDNQIYIIGLHNPTARDRAFDAYINGQFNKRFEAVSHARIRNIS